MEQGGHCQQGYCTNAAGKEIDDISTINNSELAMASHLPARR
jgi:hypothetical protein